jgi:hypothetical protein
MFRPSFLVVMASSRGRLSFCAAASGHHYEQLGKFNQLHYQYPYLKNAKALQVKNSPKHSGWTAVASRDWPTLSEQRLRAIPCYFRAVGVVSKTRIVHENTSVGESHRDLQHH